MGFSKGNQFGKTTKRGKNKITLELKQFLENITIETINSLDIQKLSNSEKIKLIGVGLNYILPKLSNTQIEAEISQNSDWVNDFTEQELEILLRNAK